MELMTADKLAEDRLRWAKFLEKERDSARAEAKALKTRVAVLESLIDSAAMTLMRTDGRVASDVAVQQVWRDCVSAIESKEGGELES